jgi:methylated-DNA-[protein]-cysteine S-methyltransferase
MIAPTNTPPFDSIHEPDPDALTRLHARLERDAAHDGLLDVSYRTVDTPIGSLLLAATDTGLVRVAFDLEGHDTVLANLASTISPRILQSPRRLDRATEQLDEYFTGRRRVFDIAIDLQLAHGFRRAVLDHLRAVAYGTTVTYASLAASAGSPAAVRAVGTACATNPLPVVIPCHRVVRTDGTIGQYLGGTEVKRTLLAMESAR